MNVIDATDQIPKTHKVEIQPATPQANYIIIKKHLHNPQPNPRGVGATLNKAFVEEDIMN